MLLYRVGIHQPRSRRGSRGHPLTVDRSAQGGGRWDNPASYAVLYLAGQRDGAIAEVFQGVEVWSSEMFRHPASGLDRTLLTYDVDTATRWCDLDDPHRLIEFALAPSRVVTKNKATTQAAALRIFESGAFDGIQWWSSLDADMTVYALWNLNVARFVEAEPLDIDHPAVEAAARRLAKPRG